MHNAIDAGANVINIAFASSSSQNQVNSENVLPQLKGMIDEKWTGSVEQPAYSCRSIGPMISFFSPESGTLVGDDIVHHGVAMPALILTFSSANERLCTIVGSLPALPSRTKARLLETYKAAAANTMAKTTLIGVSFTGSILFLENQVTKLNSEFKVFTNANLCLLAHGSHTTVTYFPTGY